MNTIHETEDGLQVTVEVRAPLGLHARPAGRLVAEAQQFSAELIVRTPTEQADAKSILDILSLAVPHGAILELCGKGCDARPALERLACLFETELRE